MREHDPATLSDTYAPDDAQDHEGPHESPEKQGADAKVRILRRRDDEVDGRAQVRDGRSRKQWEIRWSGKLDGASQTERCKSRTEQLTA